MRAVGASGSPSATETAPGYVSSSRSLSRSAGGGRGEGDSARPPCVAPNCTASALELAARLPNRAARRRGSASPFRRRPRARGGSSNAGPAGAHARQTRRWPREEHSLIWDGRDGAQHGPSDLPGARRKALRPRHARSRSFGSTNHPKPAATHGGGFAMGAPSEALGITPRLHRRRRCSGTLLRDRLSVRRAGPRSMGRCTARTDARLDREVASSLSRPNCLRCGSRIAFSGEA
jgi:hypothetical protein